ncbi:catalase-peroxidase 2 [Paraferrimonas sedimenticola]|uniref:Catalase-peroxidase n=2 Tax=Paraferrimonas sedimenticola TaxID=375674 RepID=A0AA37RTJ9_9GAMM|nr:catalase-peroxidase 2 [Paraferrimonas sedimenticola]
MKTRLKKLMLASVAASVMATSGVASAAGAAKSNQYWWPEQLDLSPLRSHDARSNPYGADFDYAAEFAKLDLDEVKKDIAKTLTTSQPWWPADWGTYGPFMIRMAWHSAGTYRVGDGRGGAAGGQMRFDPLNSWPDNANLDKARRLLWPIKQKYGRQLSWADLMILTGNVALEESGFKTFGFAGGRADDWEPDVVYWGPEMKMLEDDRRDSKGKLKGDLAAVQMGLIYVNPEGPGANHDPLSAAQDMRMSFGRMAMNDEEIVALVAGGHTLGKAHGARSADCVGVEPGAAPIEDQGFGWKNKCGKGNAEDTVTSGLEGAWTSTPTTWSIQYLTNLFAYEWKQTKSPAGATQWIPTDPNAANLVPDAHIEGKRHAPIMFTTDLALKRDPGFREISERFMKDPAAFDLAFGKAWFKLTHRDMGPRARYVGSEVPSEALLWQDPIPSVEHKLIDEFDVAKLKGKILGSGISNADLIKTAWAAASSFRITDMRGGANGARIALEPQNQWAVNDPASLNATLDKLKAVRAEFNEELSGGKQVSLADVIVLGGSAAVERAAKNAGHDITLPFNPGRGDATQAQTDVKSFAVLEPKADAFRNYFTQDSFYAPAEAMVDRASLLNLTVPEMTALIGGLRVLGANTGNSKHGVFTERSDTLSNDFFVNLLDMATRWAPAEQEGVYNGYDRASGELKWTGTTVDLIFGSNTELRAVAEVYAANDGEAKLAQDFADAWSKVMNADRF